MDHLSHKSRMVQALKPWARLLLSMGSDPRQLAAIRHFPRYRAHKRHFRQLGGTISHSHPILTDFDAGAGAAGGHYFHQDLLVASFVNERKPQRHIDIGSRIDGFVAHVAAFREIEVMDIRQLPESGHPNIRFLQADLMKEASGLEAAADSVSCLHAIEHFGLGRYGDPVDPQGHRKGFDNILKLVRPGGFLYVSFPIGRRNEVHFNAHRVFDPRDVLGWAADPDVITLRRFDFVDDAGALHRSVDLHATRPEVTYGCGIYTFEKRA